MSFHQTDEPVSNFHGRPIGGGGDSFALRLPALPVMLGFVRRQLGRWLEGHGVVRDDAADLTLACSEACANAMEHPLSAAQPAVEIRALLRAEAVELAVRDFGSWSGRSEGGNRGRGLEMIRALVDEVTIARHECGTTVTIRRLRSRRAQASSAEIGTST